MERAKPVENRRSRGGAGTKFHLAFSAREIKYLAFFDSANLVFALYRNQMSGNPVRIGDGCATVTGYKLPMPLVV